MIQLPPSLPAAAAADVAQPAMASEVLQNPQLQGEAMQGFGERMRLAALDLGGDQPVQVTLDEVAAAMGDPLTVPGGEEAVAEFAGLELLEIIERQLAEAQARDADEAIVVSELPAQVPTQQTERADERLAWWPAPRQPAEAPTGDALPTQDASVEFRADRAVEAPATGSRFAEQAVAQRIGEKVATPVAMPASAAAALQMADAAAATPAPEMPLPVTEGLEGSEPLAAMERTQPLPERVLKLQAPQAKWGEQMLHALKENVEMQVQQKIQNATIRLDPPELGSLEILLSHESGRLNVQLSAANVDVARLLQQTSDRLRQELVSQNFVQVNVQVGSEGGGQQGQQRQRAALMAEEAPLPARTPEQEQEASRTAERARDVLITV